MASTLVVHAGGIRRTREELATLATPLPTATWKPIAHYDLVMELISAFEKQGVRVGRDDYCTMKQDNRLLGVMDLVVPDLDTPEFGMSLGLRTSNDQSWRVEALAAARVFACDNMAFSGDRGAVCLKKKHTSGLNLAQVVPQAIEEFLEKAGQFRLDLDRLHEMGVSDSRAKELIFDGFCGDQPVAPLRLLPEIARLYLADEEQRSMFPERTLWSLNNSFTQAVKALPPSSQHQSGRKIGRLFSRVLRGEDTVDQFAFA